MSQPDESRVPHQDSAPDADPSGASRTRDRTGTSGETGSGGDLGTAEGADPTRASGVDADPTAVGRGDAAVGRDELADGPPSGEPADRPISEDGSATGTTAARQDLPVHTEGAPGNGAETDETTTGSGTDPDRDGGPSGQFGPPPAGPPSASAGDPAADSPEASPLAGYPPAGYPPGTYGAGQGAGGRPAGHDGPSGGAYGPYPRGDFGGTQSGSYGGAPGSGTQPGGTGPAATGGFGHAQPAGYGGPPGGYGGSPGGYGGSPGGYGGSPGGYGGPPTGYPGPPTGYGSYPPPGWAPPRPTNGMAIASLVLGALWLYWVGSILALIFGYQARKQIAERGEEGGGLATAGIVLGWIGVGVLAVVTLGGIFLAVMSTFS